MLPSTCSWTSNYESAYPPSTSLTSLGGRSHPMTMPNPSSHWGAPSHRLQESGFVPPAVDMRYPSDWASGGKNAVSPRGSTGFPVKDELTDPSDYSSEDTYSDYRDAITGNPEYRGDLTERTRRTMEKRNDNEEMMSVEEVQKRRIRRERNKLAAARCRQRRVDLTNQLLAETETLEDERDRLQKEIQGLQRQRAQLEDLLGTHAPRCQSRSLISSNIIDIPPIKAEKCDDYFNMAETGLYGAPCSSYSLPSTTFQSCSRPDSLPLIRRTPASTLNATNATNATQSHATTVTTNATTGIANLGLDCMLDGHTGLTPITGAPSVADHVVRTPVNCGGYSPTTLMTL